MTPPKFRAMGKHYVRLGGSSIEVAESEVKMKAVVDQKIRTRIIPILFIAALLCYIDRTNLSFAALQMNKDLRLSHSVYGIGAGIFFATYAVFGIPSSLLVKRMGARLGMPLILILWGIASGGMAFIQSTRDFYVLRLLVGATEAGFFPAVIYYLTLWFDEEDMGLSYTTVMTSTALSGVIGGPLATVIMTYCDNLFGMRGWRWLFICEAVPTIVLGFVMLFYLDGEPQYARFLTIEERNWLVARQKRQEENRSERHAVNGLYHALRLKWLWIIIGVWLLYSCGYYGIIFWLPLLIESLGLNSNIVLVGFLSSIPYVCAAAAMLSVARSSDRQLERRLHLALPALIAAIGFFGAAAIHSFFGNQLVPLLACLSLAASGVWAMFGPYWAIPTAMLTGDTAAAGFALINSLGVVGGYVGPYLVGLLTDEFGSYDISLAIFGVMMTVSGSLALCLRHDIGSNAEPHSTPLAVNSSRVKYLDEENQALSSNGTQTSST